MYEFTLLKSMFFELDKYKIEGVTQTKEKQRTFRRLEVSYDSVYYSRRENSSICGQILSFY